MKNVRVAKRYARSLLQVAQDNAALEAVRAAVEIFDAAFAASAPLRALLRNPVVAAERKSAILDAIFGERVHPIFRAFLKLVCIKGRENILDSITAQFVNLYNEHKGITVAVVSAAVEVPDPLHERIKAFIARRFGGTPYVEYRIDPTLLGGLVIQCGDVRLDASIAGHLARLRKQLSVVNGKQV
ncbi:MAG: ATP synthase F1 subunit delta [Bacteroidota bacterium]|nr:ATP synthase F1 subunit delta [Candidatus Kapabacteria bacterium]MCS7302568.1 ATP synthase F1 subunit delta [Candidatus Kapabacteria bacterium]MCX7936746.1 ATP synthase F1 subunit delta [Chlorobiota bacterium]MDW8074210.1 ATP synthase F1 subunit delta [Bacteroidota bacterium]MDW8271314.1 ATP synthase F1 subunit delta [Bacteroidota bacterium]